MKQWLVAEVPDTELARYCIVHFSKNSPLHRFESCVCNHCESLITYMFDLVSVMRLNLVSFTQQNSQKFLPVLALRDVLTYCSMPVASHRNSEAAIVYKFVLDWRA